MGENLSDLVTQGLSDYRVRSIAWSEDGRNLRLTLRGPGLPSVKEQVVTFVWVTGVRIHMDFGVYSGMPLLFSSRFDQLSGGRWACELEFGAAPDGVMCWECDAICVESPERGPE